MSEENDVSTWTELEIIIFQIGSQCNPQSTLIICSHLELLSYGIQLIIFVIWAKVSGKDYIPVYADHLTQTGLSICTEFTFSNHRL